MRILTVLFSLILVTACVGPQTTGPQGSSAEIRAEKDKQNALMFQNYMDYYTRLYHLSHPILVKNAEFCGAKTGPTVGISFWNIHSVPNAYKRVMANSGELGEDLVVHSVIPNGPAAKSGLRKGDLLLSINGEPIPRDKNAVKATREMLNKAGFRRSEIAYIRNNTPRTTSIAPVKECDYPVVLDNSAKVNAYADGKSIIVTRGIMRFAESDDELALVVAHELAHNVMGHIQKLKTNVMAGALGGLAVDALLGAAGVGTGGQFSQIGGSLGQQRFSVGFEQEADYVGMYFMANAGYNTGNVANFWRRMAAEGQSSIDHRTSHPSSPERFIAIERTHSEIQNKKARGQKLAPNLAPQ